MQRRLPGTPWPPEGGNVAGRGRKKLIINIKSVAFWRRLGDLMNIPSLIFYAVFVVPLVIFLIWLMRQDKRKGKIGLIVLAIMVVGGIAYMYWKTKGQ